MTASAAANAGAKQRGRPFAPGESGNPAGKRPGTRNRASALLETISDDDLTTILAKLVSQAKAGDLTAIKILLDRLVPPPRARAVAIDLPSLRDGTAKSKGLALVAVLDAVARGDLASDEAERIAALITAAADAAANAYGLNPPTRAQREAAAAAEAARRAAPLTRLQRTFLGQE